jgi:3-methyladenine DNA glycosylase AlkD
MNSTEFIDTLKSYQSDKERKKIENYFHGDHGSDNEIIGVRMKKIFDLAKDYRDMPLGEVEELLESSYYEARMGAAAVLDFKARLKLSEEDHRQLYELYLKRHDRINNWDLVDRAAIRVVGRFLYEFDKPRDVLFELAKSNNVWERRSAIVSTAYFIRKGDLDDTFAIAEVLIDDNRETIQKAVGAWLRHAGKSDETRLTDFLDEYAPQMPPTMLRFAIQKLDKSQRSHYRQLNKQ